MRTRPFSERRADGQNRFTQPTFFPVGMLRTRALRIVAAGTFLVGLADYLTGHEIWFGPFYLLVIGVGAWSLGWREALVLAITCLFLVFALNGADLSPQGSATDKWNFSVRILSVLIVIYLLDKASNHYASEWWRARTDPLTGVLNRQAFFEIVGVISHSNEWSLLAFADLDGLKKINDQEGHAKGDQCLKEYASSVQKVIRAGDVFARIGGDEFLIHMAIKDEAAGKIVSKRLHSSMNSIVAKLSRNLRCSVGTVLVPPGLKAIERYVEIADELMYAAKSSGASLRVATGRQSGEGLVLTGHEDCALSYNGDLPDMAEATGSGQFEVAHGLKPRLVPPTAKSQRSVSGQAAA
jgi:diguanylate cyclase (GGDEF)-like protein